MLGELLTCDERPEALRASGGGPYNKGSVFGGPELDEGAVGVGDDVAAAQMIGVVEAQPRERLRSSLRNLEDY